jgi:hypothetical protein
VWASLNGVIALVDAPWCCGHDHTPSKQYNRRVFLTRIDGAPDDATNRTSAELISDKGNSVVTVGKVGLWIAVSFDSIDHIHVEPGFGRTAIHCT